MSTRATYTFVLPYGGNVSMYIHHDGYPEGAAAYLLAAHLSNAHGSLADRFHRVNDRAELTARDAHGDIEYSYVIHADGTLSARKRDVRSDEWSAIFAGHYAEFINHYAPAEAMTDGKLRHIALRPLFSCWPDRREWVTRGQLERRHAAKIAELESYRERFPEHTGNLSGLESEVAALALALMQYDEPEVKQ